MQNFYLSLNCRGTKVWTSLFLFRIRCLIPQTDQTQNNILINVMNTSKYIFPYSQEMSFYLSVKPREYKELLHYNCNFCLHRNRNAVVKFYVWWIHLLIFKLALVVSGSPRVLLKQSTPSYRGHKGNSCWNESPLWFPRRSVPVMNTLLCVLFVSLEQPLN